jgi:DNA-binding MarR family transcriptional regulator
LWAILLRLASSAGPAASPGGEEIAASQDELASIANLSRTAVGLMLRSFEASGLIERRYRRIRLHSNAGVPSGAVDGK